MSKSPEPQDSKSPARKAKESDEQPCPMVAARIRAGLTLEQAAKKARVQPRYLKRFENKGGDCPLSLALALSRIYGCSEFVFLRFAPAKGKTIEASTSAAADVQQPSSQKASGAPVSPLSTEQRKRPKRERSN